MVALVTPFVNGRYDKKRYRRLIEWHIEQGTSVIVALGTTGESPTVNFSLHKRIIRDAVKFTDRRIPVIAGTGANSTEEAVELARSALEVGADAHLSVVPYYNRPTQTGLFNHFRKIADEVGLPMILYNVPGRTVVNMEPSTVRELAQYQNIIGIKEASGNLRQISDIIRLCGKDFVVLSGDDFTTFPAMALGVRGTISVTANVIPKQVAQMCAAMKAGNHEEARRLHFLMEPLNALLFKVSNPIPVKMVMTALGLLDEPGLLPPLYVEMRLVDEINRVLDEQGIVASDF